MIARMVLLPIVVIGAHIALAACDRIHRDPVDRAAVERAYLQAIKMGRPTFHYTDSVAVYQCPVAPGNCKVVTVLTPSGGS